MKQRCQEEERRIKSLTKFTKVKMEKCIYCEKLIGIEGEIKHWGKYTYHKKCFRKLKKEAKRAF